MDFSENKEIGEDKDAEFGGVIRGNQTDRPDSDGGELAVLGFFM